ncbi:hypothetical protein [Streptomyces megasporus]|uniref:hypothetical protein n=1 Tax=Streptomyces megasporus TaxID=44060 RepID=UPI000A64377E|nr:hypothetical protein [Streptomyces megasporus]
MVTARGRNLDAPADVVLVRRRTLPDTSGGKLRRSRCADLYERGELGPFHRHAAPSV